MLSKLNKISTSFTKTHNELYVCAISVKELLKLNVQPWEYQRQLNEDHVKYLEDEYVKAKSDTILYESQIHFILIKDELKCIDGQHRIEALKNISNERQHEIKFNLERSTIDIKLHNVTNWLIDDIKSLYLRINGGMKQLSPEISQMEKDIKIKSIKDYDINIDSILDNFKKSMIKKYKNINETSNTPRPKFNINCLVHSDNFTQIVIKMGMKSGDDLFQNFEAFNEYLDGKNYEYYYKLLLKNSNNKGKIGILERTFKYIYSYSYKSYNRIGMFSKNDSDILELIKVFNEFYDEIL